MRRISRLAFVWAACFLCAAVSGASAQVLDQVPSDALMVVRVKNLAQTNEKIAALAKQFGLAEIKPELADPLGWLQTTFKVQNGLDKAGDFAIVMLNHDFNGPTPPPLLLIPVSDYRAFLGNFGEARKEGELDVVKASFHGNEQEAFVASWGRYAAMSPQKDALAKKPDGLKVSGAVAKELASKDIVVLGNFKVLGPKVLPEFQQRKQEVVGQIEQALTQMPGSNPKMVPVVKAFVAQAMNWAEQFLQEAEYGTFAIDFLKDGIAPSAVVQFREDSQLGQTAKGLTNVDQSLLMGLPEQKYLMFGGLSLSDRGRKALEDFLMPIMAELDKLGEEGKPTGYAELTKQALAATKSSSFGWLMPPQGVGGLFQIVGVNTGDAKVLLETHQKMVEAQERLMNIMQGAGGIGIKNEFKANAKTIEGVSLNELRTSIDANANSPQAMQAKQMMDMMYGPQGAVAYSGAVDDKHLVTGVSVDDAVLAATIKAIKAGEAPLAKQGPVQVSAQHLPKQYVGVGFVAVDNLMTTIANYAAMFGFPIPLALKENIPPVGVAISSDGAAVRIDSFVSSDLIESIVSTYLKMKIGGAGGGQAPKGGL